MRFSAVLLVLAPTLVSLTGAYSVTPVSRRNAVAAGFSFLSAGVVAATAIPQVANAEPDCMTDCLKSCKLIAPKDPSYCLDNCKSYCEQEDRADGLSGSVSSANGETGILGTTTVVKGEDKPPQVNLPGLDFSKGAGKKLIGY
eukprot:CAMPEP_0119014494 /NCGR_PEP_ID=MMETSP1176-20130426/9843_1 /TAXON_ID=265551 /ORGANISM="Synedropsis recta cf, Strain CCMP1620" /LENGTH=142 /DNA_ID=CAMNT_0006967683 /DNA_START=21 /DNA_END=449 /DNA_ORIENTATION=+